MPFTKVFREVLIEVLSFGFGVAVLVLGLLLVVLLVDGVSLVHTMIYGTHKQPHNKEKGIKVLSLSSNREKKDMKIGRIFLGGFIMARLKLY